MNVHVYFIGYQGESLVASHLSPVEFGRYMAVGTRKHTGGNTIFFEIDPSFTSGYFNLPDVKTSCTLHADGSPRRSKYISIYRVLEHLPLDAFMKLYLVARDGRVLAIESSSYNADALTDRFHFYTELSPVIPRVLSRLSPPAFTRFITDPDNPLYVPRILFADSLLEVDADGRLAGYLPYPDPVHIADCIMDLVSRPEKMTKTVDRNPRLIAFYRTISKGFMIGDQSGMKYYAFPLRDELEETHQSWWRSACVD